MAAEGKGENPWGEGKWPQTKTQEKGDLGCNQRDGEQMTFRCKKHRRDKRKARFFTGRERPKRLSNLVAARREKRGRGVRLVRRISGEERAAVGGGEHTLGEGETTRKRSTHGRK